MDINASIIDQRLVSVQEEIRQTALDEMGIRQEDKLRSLAFVYLCVRTILDIDGAKAFDCLTEGGGDFGVDAMHISEEHDGEFTISLFQGKYKKNLDGSSNFPETGIKMLIDAIGALFDPGTELRHLNDRLLTRIEEARSLIRDGLIPRVRVLACNNGLEWNAAAQETIERSGFGDQVTWEHVNHERLVKIIQASKAVNDTLQLSGKAIVEDMDFSRVLIGRVSIQEIAGLIERHGERLLQRNIRRYLGLQGNRVNEAIRETLKSPESSNFYFYNNGITLTCDKFSYNALQSGDYKVKIENLQIINGGQTCMTIHKTLGEPKQRPLFSQPEQTFVLVRLYQLPSDNKELVNSITFATNSQNPVDLRDLRANDERQRRLELDIEQLGFTYRRKRSDESGKSDITAGSCAEAVLAVWRRRPHQAKFFTREHFGKLYDLIFSEELNGAQTICAVLLYRIAENRRRRPSPDDPMFVRYASCFIAMQMGRRLLHDIDVTVSGLTHKNFDAAHRLIKQRGNDYFRESVQDIADALKSLYGKKEVSLQQLSATFRRGDLIQTLLNMALPKTRGDSKPTR